MCNRLEGQGPTASHDAAAPSSSAGPRGEVGKAFPTSTLITTTIIYYRYPPSGCD